MTLGVGSNRGQNMTYHDEMIELNALDLDCVSGGSGWGAVVGGVIGGTVFGAAGAIGGPVGIVALGAVGVAYGAAVGHAITEQ
jgi:hypothetical protein